MWWLLCIVTTLWDMCNSCGHTIITLDVTSLLDSRQENWSPDILYKVKDTFSIYLFTFAENKLMKCPISLSLSNDLCVCVFFFLGLFEKWRKVFFFSLRLSEKWCILDYVLTTNHKENSRQRYDNEYTPQGWLSKIFLSCGIDAYLFYCTSLSFSSALPGNVKAPCDEELVPSLSSSAGEFVSGLGVERMSSRDEASIR